MSTLHRVLNHKETTVMLCVLYTYLLLTRIILFLVRLSLYHDCPSIIDRLTEYASDIA